MPVVFRKWRFHLFGRSELLSFCQVEHASGLQKVVFPSFWALEAPVFPPSRTCQWSSKKWRFHLSGRSRLFSFCTVERASDVQKVVFPSCWALEALLVLHSRARQRFSESGVSIFLGARGFSRSALLHSRTCQRSSASGASIFLGARGSCRSAQ